MAAAQREAEELRNGTYNFAGGSVVYVISAVVA